MKIPFFTTLVLMTVGCLGGPAFEASKQEAPTPVLEDSGAPALQSDAAPMRHEDAGIAVDSGERLTPDAATKVLDDAGPAATEDTGSPAPACHWLYNTVYTAGDAGAETTSGTIAGPGPGGSAWECPAGYPFAVECDDGDAGGADSRVPLVASTNPAVMCAACEPFLYGYSFVCPDQDQTPWECFPAAPLPAKCSQVAPGGTASVYTQACCQ